ncbi:hypothetical protein ACJX0J_031184, partial [Zea mays]
IITIFGLSLGQMMLQPIEVAKSKILYQGLLLLKNYVCANYSKKTSDAKALSFNVLSSKMSKLIFILLEKKQPTDLLKLYLLIVCSDNIRAKGASRQLTDY